MTDETMDVLALAAKDALAAAEQRGFARAVTFITAQLEQSDHLRLFMSTGRGEATLALEIANEDESDLLIQTRRVFLSDIIYEQWPTCKGSVIAVRDEVVKSIAQVDRIVEDWGKYGADEAHPLP